MKIEIEVDDSSFTKEKLAELENYFVKKIIGVKVGISEIRLPDVFAHLVFKAISKKLEDNYEKVIIWSL